MQVTIVAHGPDDRDGATCIIHRDDGSRVAQEYTRLTGAREAGRVALLRSNNPMDSYWTLKDYTETLV